MTNDVSRGQWGSKLGFILAASGSAIGLGNVVFFSANAYKFGAGAFYVPYLIALAVVGVPVMIMEFGLGGLSRRSFPGAMRQVAGQGGEFLGWWALMNALFICMYYTTIVGWVLGMWLGAFGESLWAESVALPKYGYVDQGGMAEGAVPNPPAYFFSMLARWSCVLFVAVIWIINLIICYRGTKSIEKAVRVFVPLMWLFMIVLIIRGVSLPGGLDGVYLLFTPDFKAMGEIEVWRGAFSQIFFTLSLGFGIMTAYASYLPRKSDHTSSALMIASMNCGFEFIAGLAIFSLIFVFAIAPKASTLGMMFFVVPQGIASLPAGAQAFGILFFTLLLLAGLSSTISLVEGLGSGLIDKFGTGMGVGARRLVLVVICLLGFAGSAIFAWPTVVDPFLKDDGTLGFTLIDLVNHWAFDYGLLICGLFECLLVGWVFGAGKLRAYLNEHSSFHLGVWFDVLIKFIIPALLAVLIGFGVYGEFGEDGLYGAKMAGSSKALAAGIAVCWMTTTVVVAAVLVLLTRPEEPSREEESTEVSS